MSSFNPQSNSGLTCNACGIIFDDGMQQRTHMRQPWHVLNVKRRVAELPPISKIQFEEQHPTTSSGLQRVKPSETYEEDLDADSDQAPQSAVESSSQCLFCAHTSTTVETNLDHMLTIHGLFVSHPECLIDTESFIQYLRTVITESHECLLCGLTRPTTEGIRQHMLDKGHCLLNIEAEPELLEFWEFPDSSGGEEGEDEVASAFVSKASDIPVFQKISDTEIRLARGTVVGSRSNKYAQRLNRKRRATVRAAKMEAIEAAKAARTGEQAHGSPDLTDSARDNRVAIRGELGMIGVTDQQKRALLAVEKKAQKQDEVLKASHQWVIASETNISKRSRRALSRAGGVHLRLTDR